MKNTTYSFSFPTMVSPITRQMKLESDTVSVEQSLKSLLSTSKGELLGDPAFGCNILKYVYDNNDAILSDVIRTEIITAINNYETRVTVTKNDIVINKDIDNNLLLIKIKYVINITGNEGYVSISYNI